MVRPVFFDGGWNLEENRLDRMTMAQMAQMIIGLRQAIIEHKLAMSEYRPAEYDLKLWSVLDKA